MDLRAHFASIWRQKWAVFGIAVAVAALVVGAMETMHKTYEAVAQIRVTPATSANGDPTSSQQDATFLASTYAHLATTRPVVSQAASGSKLGISEQTAAHRISVSASSSVGFLTVSATGPTSGDAAALAANEVQALLSSVQAQQAATLQTELAPVQAQIKTVQDQLSSPTVLANTSLSSALNSELQALIQASTQRQLQPRDQLTIVAPARAEPGPVAPKPLRSGLLAFVTSLVIAAELAAAREALSDRFAVDDIDDEVTRVMGVPALAHIPQGGGQDLIEAFRTLRTNLLFMTEAGQTRTVAVVSVDPGAGKSFVAIHLATAIAELGVAGALIDGDMRRPVIHERLGLMRQPGLSDMLAGTDLSECGHIFPGHENLLVIPAGSPTPDPAGALSRGLTRRVLEGLPAARLIVLDTPAESVFPDAATIAAHCDATLVVIDPGSSKRRSARAMMARLRQVGARPLGVVINRSVAAPRSAAYYARGSQPAEPAASSA